MIALLALAATVVTALIAGLFLILAMEEQPSMLSDELVEQDASRRI